MGLYPLIPVIYGSYAVIIWLGTRLRERRSATTIAASALAGEVLFFVITNFAHWAVQTDTYPHTFAGLMECYLVGIPFFRKLVVNMAKVEFLDSTGLGVLVGGLKRVRAHDGSLDLVCTQERILKIFRITGLTKVFGIFDSVDEAVAHKKSEK